MAITVVKYPYGHLLSTTANTATVSNSSGTALFTNAGHGLIDGDYVYIYSQFEQYNGYWYVNQISVDTFQIREYATATDVAYLNSGSVIYYDATVTSIVNCVHLPIIYKLKSDLWPINGVDTARTITTFTNWNGYTYLVLNGDLKSSGTASSLENVILSGVTGVDGADITGVYRIIQWFSETNIVIDLVYDAGNVLSAGTCQYYYLNYHAKVKIYAGLPASHNWDAMNPYEHLATVKVVFDSTGIGVLNISDIIKSKIDILANNLQLDSLPCNVDAFCTAYLSYAESYDDSDGYTIEEYTSSYTDDSSNYIIAVNSKLPFKTRSGGALDLHTWYPTGGVNEKFLTPFTQPTLFAGYYFDLSFLQVTSDGTTYAKIDRYTSGVPVTTLDTTTLAIANNWGVQRLNIEQTGSEDRIDITIYNSTYAEQVTETITIDVVSECDQYRTTNMYLTWLNYLGGYDYWLFTAQKLFSVDVEESKTQDINIYNDWPNSYGEFAHSIRKQSVRGTRNVVKVTSQYLTKEQMDALAWIVSSPLVQILTTETVNEIDITTQRTVIVDTASLSKYKDRDNLYSISFNISYTDELPAQSL